MKNDEIALKNIRNLLNLKEDEIPDFDLRIKDKKYKDKIENINILIDENEKESIRYLWNHLYLPYEYEMDEDYTEASKGFIDSYYSKRKEWVENTTLFHHDDISQNVLRNINEPLIGDRIILRAAKEKEDELYYKHLVEDGDFYYYTMIPLEKGNPHLISYNIYYPYSFVVTLKEDDTPIGVVGLRNIRKDSTHTERLEASVLSYYIYKEYRQNGYAKEALKLLLNAYFNEDLIGITKTDYNFEMEIERVKAISVSLDCSINNIPSIKLAKSMGFIEEGHLHNTWCIDNEYSDGLFFFINKEMYNK